MIHNHPTSRRPAAQQRLRFCREAVQRLYRASVSHTYDVIQFTEALVSFPKRSNC
jgi:hypothetical protein